MWVRDMKDRRGQGACVGEGHGQEGSRAVWVRDMDRRGQGACVGERHEGQEGSRGVCG